MTLGTPGQGTMNFIFNFLPKQHIFVVVHGGEPLCMSALFFLLDSEECTWEEVGSSDFGLSRIGSGGVFL